MSEVIPFKKFPSFIETITLDGKVYNFKFRWNSRESAWYMDIRDNVNILILSGIKIVNGWELIKRYTDVRLPQGSLFVTHISGSKKRIVRNSFLDDFRLVYFNEEETNAV